MIVEERTEYRYPRFKSKYLVRDLSFQRGPAPGQPFPNFDLELVDGGRIRKEDLLGRKPFLITLGSATCPMTAAADLSLKPLYEEFGGRVEFLTLYVREAHPGDRIPQPETFEEKLRHARAFKRRDRLPWAVAIDDIDGTLHQRLGSHPNAAYMVDIEGNVAYRVLWSNDPKAIRRGLEAIVAGQLAPIGEESLPFRALALRGRHDGPDPRASRPIGQARRDDAAAAHVRSGQAGRDIQALASGGPLLGRLGRGRGRVGGRLRLKPASSPLAALGNSPAGASTPAGPRPCRRPRASNR
ncbi:MAG: hypothetical protein HY549_12925 [Elusimicrobia bacterium]|nr:hypothetical protein [Elusimicrobiota bacterium]